MTPRMQKQAENEWKRHEDKLTLIANNRLFELKVWFEKHFKSDKTLDIVFGMGSHCVHINREFIDVELYPHTAYYRGRPCKALKPIAEAIEDVENITDQFRRACPENLIVKGNRK